MHFIWNHLHYSLLLFYPVSFFFYGYFEALIFVFISTLCYFIFSQPTFLNKEQRAMEALKRRQQQVEEQRKKTEVHVQERRSLLFDQTNFVIRLCFQIFQCGWQIQKFQILYFVIQEERQIREKFLREAQYSRGLSFLFSYTN